MVFADGAILVIPSSFRPSPDTVATRVDDEVVLVHLKTERIHVLNRTGARLWALLCAGHDWPQVRSVILREFQVTEGQLDAEMDDLLEMLREEQLIDSDGGRPA